MDVNKVLTWGACSPEEAQVLRDLQANILLPNRHESGICYFLHFDRPDENAAARFLATLGREVKNAWEQLDEMVNKSPTGTVTFYLTYKGYQELKVPEGRIPANDTSFLSGMLSRSEIFELDDQHRDLWEPHFRGEYGDIHAMLFIGDRNHQAAKERAQQLETGWPDWVTVIATEEAKVWRNQQRQVVEHFGFRDGISQPVFVRTKPPSTAFRRWRNEFELDKVIVPVPGGDGTAFGSYLAFLKLEQNIPSFATMTRKLAEALNPQDPNIEHAAALTIGRYQSGKPLVMDPSSQHRDDDNDFDYRSDIDGLDCPLHAHIRKVCPRGDRSIRRYGTREDERAMLIVRRGMTYGSRQDDPSQPPDPLDRKLATGNGMLFMSFQKSIRDNFEYVYKTWANGRDFVWDNTGPDPIIGQGLRTAQAWPLGRGSTEKRDFLFESCVTIKGGEYFFAPPKSFLSRSHA